MAIQFDPSDDFSRVVDGTESVTVTRSADATGTQVTHALRRTLRVGEAEKSDGRYTASDITWHLPVDELTAAPQPGDVIIDQQDQRWSVLDVQKTPIKSCWRCVCRNLAVVHGLDAYVDIEKVTYRKGDGGADEPTWHTWKTGLAARIQPAETRVEDEHERRATAAGFKVFLAEDVTVGRTHRIKGPDGTIYRVIGCRKAGRIDALMEIDVVRVD